MKERKPRTSEDAGWLAEDYRQARKAELWTPASKKGGPKSCYSCEQPGHLAKDCYMKKLASRTSIKGEDVAKSEKKKKEGKPLICYNCGGHGHTSRQCPSDALFCGARNPASYSGIGQLETQPFQCERVVEGQFVNDIVLDTGCSRTLVRNDLVGEESLRLGKAVSIQCAHGDAVTYPLAGVEAAVSDTLPQSVLLETDVPDLTELLKSKGNEKTLMVVTRSQVQRL